MSSNGGLAAVHVDIISEIIGYFSVANILYLHKIGNKKLWRTVLASLSKAQYGMVCTEELDRYFTTKGRKRTVCILQNELVRLVLSQIKSFVINHKPKNEYKFAELLKKILQLQGTMSSREIVPLFDINMMYLSGSSALLKYSTFKHVFELSFDYDEKYTRQLILPPNLTDLAIDGKGYAIRENFAIWPETLEKLHLENGFIHARTLETIPNLRVLNLMYSHVYDTVLPCGTYTQMGRISLPKLEICVYCHSEHLVHLKDPECDIFFHMARTKFKYNRSKSISVILQNSTLISELSLYASPSQFIINEFANPVHNFSSLKRLTIGFSTRTESNRNLVWNLPNLTFLNVRMIMICDKNIQNLTKLEYLYLLETEPILFEDNLILTGECLSSLTSLKVFAIRFNIDESGEQLMQSMLKSNIQTIQPYTGSFTIHTIQWLKSQFKKFYLSNPKPTHTRYLTFSDRKYNRYKMLHGNKTKFDTLLEKTKQEFMDKYNIKLNTISSTSCDYY
jgi:CRISPR/Cas system-associated protein endoribonuclease Cas2